MRDDLKEYIGLFETEAQDYLQTMNNDLVKIEKNPNDKDALYNLMRIAHTLKGMCATMGFDALMRLCHSMENYFDALRKSKIEVHKKDVDAIFQVLDLLSKGIKSVANGEAEPETFSFSKKIDDFVEADINDVKESDSSKSSKSSNVDKNDEPNDLRNVGSVGDVLDYVEKIKDIKVNVKRLDKMMNLMEELIILRMRLTDADKRKKYEKFSFLVDDLDKLLDELQYNVMQSRMVGAGYLFNRFPRMVRDLAGKGNKEIDLEIEGADIELDRGIIDELGEPMVHLIRNAIDHGIDKKGVIKLNAKREKNNVVIEVIDNGGGIDLERVKNVAMEKNIKTTSELNEMSDEEIRNLIFDPMLSTSDEVSDVSGRGVGMSAVKKKIEELNGSILIESEKGSGTIFRLVLPLTMAIIRSLLVRAADELFAIPINYVHKSHKFENNQIKKVADEKVAILGENDVPLLDLANHLNIDHLEDPDKKLDKDSDKDPNADIRDVNNKENEKGVLAVIVENSGSVMGLIVDEIIKEEETIVKPLTAMLKGKKEFTGVTTLGDGRVVLILDVPNLI